MGLVLFPCTKPKSMNTRTNMDFSSLIIFLLLHFLLIVSLVCPINSSEISNHQLVNQTFRPYKEFHKLKIKKMITTRLQQLNKPAVKTIQSPDGDIIDCVLTHKQPAFDHPLLKGQKPLNPPERPRGNNQINNLSDIFQLWSLSGESCPEGTIPIRRVTEQDLLRADSIIKFGRKNLDGKTREYAYGSVDGDGYTGIKANLNVWRPRTESKDEYSLAKISVSATTSGETIEVGWQVYQNLYGDGTPRLFIYWTADQDNQTGCYNLLCSGFIQTNRKIVIGGTIHPWSSMSRNQFDVALKIWKDPFVSNWWLEYGSGNVLGYWPARLFTQLKSEAYFAQFGGEILNLMSQGSHTSTEMGSGNFQSKGYKKSAYIRNMQVAVTSHNTWIDLPDPNFSADRPNCYDVRGAYNKKWGNYLYYGGPGHNDDCPL